VSLLMLLPPPPRLAPLHPFPASHAPPRAATLACAHPAVCCLLQVSNTAAVITAQTASDTAAAIAVSSSSTLFSGTGILATAQAGTLLSLVVGSTPVFDVAAAGTTTAHFGLAAKAGVTVTGSTTITDRLEVRFFGSCWWPAPVYSHHPLPLQPLCGLKVRRRCPYSQRKAD
jgi:hypothetical protein